MKTWLPYIRLAIGFVLAWLFGWLFLELGEEIFGWVLDLFDTLIYDFTQNLRTPAGDVIMHFLSWMGSFVPYAIIGIPLIIIMIIKGYPRLAVLFIVMFSGSIALTVLLKLAYNRTRPALGLHELGKSFPSGHVLVALAFYGFLVLFISRQINWYWKIIAWFLYVLLILGIAVSRIYLGVHWTSDVIAGLLAGTAWVITCTSAFTILERLHYRRIHRES